ncbi:SDR family oxidoreductase [Agromyces sp. NPDC058126]|uniref:SDR family oxidoreductase n=1 Tax=Agromyces sp. NPDC058126 TaxID=3346350 RepID=UPI0036DF627D
MNAPERPAARRDLDGKVVLVTGASSGIGRATALALSSAGARVAVGARRVDRLDSLVDSALGEAIALQLDVTDPASVARAVEETVARFGRLDALVNYAGLMQSGMILDADVREWQRMVDTNLLGSMYAVHAALPHLLETKGAVVQVSSTAARSASLGSGVYAATKFGISAFSESLRQEITDQGVRVIVIQPGFVDTELTSHITDRGCRPQPPSSHRQYGRCVPMTSRRRSSMPSASLTTSRSTRSWCVQLTRCVDLTGHHVLRRPDRPADLLRREAQRDARIVQTERRP